MNNPNGENDGTGTIYNPTSVQLDTKVPFNSDQQNDPNAYKDAFSRMKVVDEEVYKKANSQSRTHGSQYAEDK